MKLDIIIPNYNGRRFLPACLDSLRKQSYTDFSVTVIDNGSSDDSIFLLSDKYPEVSVIKMPCNMGFASAANEGILHTESPYIMLLNNDTVLAPDCICRLMDTITRKKNIFSAGAHILDMESPRKTDTTGDFYTIFGYAFCRGQGLSPHAGGDPSVRLRTKRGLRQVFTCCGCAVVYRRDLLKKTGLFPSAYFAYLEDVNLGFRARRLGYKNVLSPEAFVYHYGSGTTGGKYTSFKVYHSSRNNIWLRKENLTALQRILHGPFVLPGTILKYLYFRKYRLQKDYLRGCLAGIFTPAPAALRTSGPVLSFLRTEPWILYGTGLYVVQYLRRRLPPQ